MHLYEIFLISQLPGFNGVFGSGIGEGLDNIKECSVHPVAKISFRNRHGKFRKYRLPDRIHNLKRNLNNPGNEV